jgi:hypothetical protein
MKKVWKFAIYPYPNSVHDAVFEMEVQMPKGARILHVGEQAGTVCVWAEVDPGNGTTPYRLYSVGTGFGAVPEGKRYIGTVQNGAYVWHIYGDNDA